MLPRTASSVSELPLFIQVEATASDFAVLPVITLIVAIVALASAIVAAYYGRESRTLLRRGVQDGLRGGLFYYEGVLREDLERLAVDNNQIRTFLKNLGQVVREQQVRRDAVLEKVTSELRENAELIRDLATHSRETDERLKEFRSGYRWSAISQVFGQVIACLDHLDDVQGTLVSTNVQTDSELLQLVHRLQVMLMSAIAGAGIEEFGSDFEGRPLAEEAARCRSVGIMPTSDEALDGRIARVRRRGYCCRPTADSLIMIRHAEVLIFKLMPNQDGVLSTSDAPTITGIV